MQIFGTIAQLPADAMQHVLSAQHLARVYLDQFAGVGRNYLAAWAAAQHSSLRTTFDVQNSALQALQTLVLDASVRGSRSLLTVQVGLTPQRHPTAPPSLAVVDGVGRENGCVASALNFQPPLGIIVAESQEETDDAP